MSFISVANLKGGVGKSSVSVSLSHGLAVRSCEVLCIDLDTQGDSLSLLGLNNSNMTNTEASKGSLESIIERHICREVRSGLDVFSLKSLQQEISSDGISKLAENSSVLKDVLEQLSYDYDYIIIDTPPALSPFHDLAFSLSDLVIIPVDPSEMSVRAAQRTLTALSLLEEHTPCMLLKTLMSRAATRINRLSDSKIENVSSEQSEQLRTIKPKRVRMKDITLEAQEIPLFLSNASIYRTEQAHRASYLGRTIFEFTQLSFLQDEYAKLFKDIESVISEYSDSLEDESFAGNSLIASLSGIAG